MSVDVWRGCSDLVGQCGSSQLVGDQGHSSGRGGFGKARLGDTRHRDVRDIRSARQSQGLDISLPGECVRDLGVEEITQERQTS